MRYFVIPRWWWWGFRGLLCQRAWLQLEKANLCNVVRNFLYRPILCAQSVSSLLSTLRLLLSSLHCCPRASRSAFSSSHHQYLYGEWLWMSVGSIYVQGKGHWEVCSCGQSYGEACRSNISPPLVRACRYFEPVKAAQSLRYDYEGLLCMADCSIFSMLRFQDDGKMLTWRWRGGLSQQ